MTMRIMTTNTKAMIMKKKSTIIITPKT